MLSVSWSPSLFCGIPAADGDVEDVEDVVDGVDGVDVVDDVGAAGVLAGVELELDGELELPQPAKARAISTGPTMARRRIAACPGIPRI